MSDRDEAALFPELPEQAPPARSSGGRPRLRRPERRQVELQALCLDDLLPPDHRVRLVWAFAEGLDLGPLYAAIKAVEGHAGHPPADPRMLMALWLNATVDGIGSARHLARLCEEHLAYRWLCGGVGVNALYVKGRVPAPLTEASCWAHGGAKFFELANLAKAMRAPMAIEAVRRIDEIFAIERELNGEPAERRRIVRQARVRPLVEGLERWMRAERSKLSSGSAAAKAMDYMVKRWTTFSAFLDDGRICLTNNAAERALRGIAVGRCNWTFAGSDRGADRAAALYTLIETARLNDVDPRAWLADVLARINDHPAKAIDDLLPWNWKAGNQADMYGPFPDGKDFLAWYR